MSFTAEAIEQRRGQRREVDRDLQCGGVRVEDEQARITVRTERVVLEVDERAAVGLAVGGRYL